MLRKPLADRTFRTWEMARRRTLGNDPEARPQRRHERRRGCLQYRLSARDEADPQGLARRLEEASDGLCGISGSLRRQGDAVPEFIAAPEVRDQPSPKMTSIFCRKLLALIATSCAFGLGAALAKDPFDANSALGCRADVFAGYVPTFSSGNVVPMEGIFAISLLPAADVAYFVRSGYGAPHGRWRSCHH